MLTKVKAYSELQEDPILFHLSTLLDEGGTVDTDLIQIRNIDGLDPVNATVNTSLYGLVDGAYYAGSNVPSRNIVLTVHPNSDWDEWTHTSLRRQLYSYFMPKRSVRLQFYSDDIVPVEISGIVESVTANMFSSDLEYFVSIICPNPHFAALEAIVIAGQSNDEPAVIDYGGNVETGFHVKLTASEDTPPTDIAIQIGDPAQQYFAVTAEVDSGKYFELNSLPLNKFVQNVTFVGEVVTNLLAKVYLQEGSLWSILQPGENLFSVITDLGVHDWELTYFERFGGL